MIVSGTAASSPFERTQYLDYIRLLLSTDEEESKCVYILNRTMEMAI